MGQNICCICTGVKTKLAKERKRQFKMRKALVIVSVLLLTLALGSAAFAGESPSVVFYGNAQSGGVSFGSHGHSWYADGDYAGTGHGLLPTIVVDPKVAVKGIYQNSSGKTGQWYSYVDSNGKDRYYFVPGSTRPVQVKGVYQDNSGKSGHWYYYLDNNGKKHYYFVPGNRAPVVVKGVFQDNSGVYDYSSVIWDLNRDGQWEFYKDARGVLHYFYVDPNRKGEYQHYTDGNGVTQYKYVYTY
jgi:hypothetical protein